MKKSFVLLLILFASCSQQGRDTLGLQSQVDSLQKKLENSYRPGLGEFMLGIQMHHAKLWFAGQAENWALADFELGEIKETLDEIRQYNTDRPEIRMLPIIEPALDSVANAVKQKNVQQFRTGFILLTLTCNNCHQATKHEFNVIQVPTTPPFSNQDFKPR